MLPSAPVCSTLHPATPGSRGLHPSVGTQHTEQRGTWAGHLYFVCRWPLPIIWTQRPTGKLGMKQTCFPTPTPIYMVPSLLVRCAWCQVRYFGHTSMMTGFARIFVHRHAALFSPQQGIPCHCRAIRSRRYLWMDLLCLNRSCLLVAGAAQSPAASHEALRSGTACPDGSRKLKLAG